MSLTRDRVLELFDVDLATGAVVWKMPTSIRVKAGRPAADPVGIDGRRYSQEHIRFLVSHGAMPVGGETFGQPEPGWRIVPGFSAAYEVSAAGEVRSRARAVLQKSGAVRLFPAVTLKPKRQKKSGYLTVQLQDAQTGAMSHPTVHSLVATAFLPPCPDGNEVRHMDGSRDNSRADNLEWGTRLDNMRDQYRHGTRIASTWHHKSKLTAEQVLQIRASSESGASIARDLGISVSTVCRARKAKTYAALTRAELPALLPAE